MNIFSSIFKNKNPDKIKPSKIKALKYSNDDEYEGSIMNEKREGFGVYKFVNGNKYEGQWHNHMKHGDGKFYYQNGELYIGEWLDNKKHGTGKYFYTNGDRYVGQWKNNDKHGQGTLYFNDGQIFTGNFEDNMKQGIGYLFVARHKKYFQNVYNLDEMIEENLKKDPPHELKRIIKTEILKKPNRPSKGDLKIPKEMKNQQDECQDNQGILLVNNEMKKSNLQFNSKIQESSTQQLDNSKNNFEINQQEQLKHVKNDSEEKLNRQYKETNSMISLDEPFYSNAFSPSQMGFDSLQVIENLKQLKETQKQVQFQEWSFTEVASWLMAEGLSQYVEAFKVNEVCGKTLMSLTDKDLKEDLGVFVLGHRKHIMKQIDMYKHYYTRFLQNKHKQRQFSFRSQNSSFKDYSVKTPDSTKGGFNSLYSQDQQRFVHILNYMEKIEEDQKENIQVSQHSNNSSDTIQGSPTQQDKQQPKEKNFDEKRKKLSKKKDRSSSSNLSKSDSSVVSTDKRKKKLGLDEKEKRKKKLKKRSDSIDSSDSQGSSNSKIKKAKKDNIPKNGQKKRETEEELRLLKKKSQKIRKRHKNPNSPPQTPESTNVLIKSNASFINNTPQSDRYEFNNTEYLLNEIQGIQRCQSVNTEGQEILIMEEQQNLTQSLQDQDLIALISLKYQLSNILVSTQDVSEAQTGTDNVGMIESAQQGEETLVVLDVITNTSPQIKPEVIQQQKIDSSQESSISSQISSMTSSSSSHSCESDEEQKKQNKPKQKSNHQHLTQNPKIKKYNMSTFMNMLKEFGINEKVLINYKELVLLNKIGEGGFGEVYMGRWLGQDVAVKVYRRKKLRGSFRYKLQMADFLKEVEVISNLRHPNIVLYMGVCQRHLSYFLITEYLEQGSLFDHLHRKQTKLDDHRILQIVEDIALGMNYLHGRKVLHCDLKSSNVLVDQNWNVKLCDFGLSRMKNTGRSGRRIGTPHWMAPEIMRGEPYDEKADVYSFGMILWELATEKIPYEGLSITQILGSVGYGDDQVLIPQCKNQTLLKLMQMCLTKETTNRPSFNQIVQIIQKGKIGNQMLKKNVIQQLIDFFD